MSLASVNPLSLGVTFGVAAGVCASNDQAADAAPVADGAGVSGLVDAPQARDQAARADRLPAVCQSDDDCQLINDCCACQAIPRGEKPASCDPKRPCVTSVCAQYQGVDRAHCSAGRCVLGFVCDPAKVLCKRLPPICPSGQVPQVVSGCFGECVDARQCSTVPSCAVCAPADACVRAVDALLGLHCQAPQSASRGM
jgi:hypothetical protein